MKPLQWIILMTFIDGLTALSGGFSLILSRESLNKILLFLVSFSVGALIGGACFHLIPEALNEITVSKTALIFTIGLLTFYLIEKALYWHHCHDEKCNEHPFTYLILFGDAIHNFIDGLIIAGSFLVSVTLGLTTSLLVIAHELPQEIGDFGILVYGGFNIKKALLYNFLVQLTAIMGGVLGYYFLSLNKYFLFLLPFAAGGFVYIAVGDLIPQVFKEKDKTKRIIHLLAMVLGALVLISAKWFAG